MNRMFALRRLSKPAVNVALLLFGACFVSFFTGCLSKAQRPQLTEKRELTTPTSLQLVKDLTRPWGVKWIEVEGVTLTVGLEGTGSDPAPSEDYKMLVSEMQVRNVDRPEAVLASQSTALALVRALIPPGAQKGDRVDVEVRVPAKSKTSDLNGGWMMLTRLKEFARVNGRLSSGHVMAMAQGNILVDSLIEGADDPVLKTRGRILGGGVVTKSRELGLRVRDENMTVRTSAQVGEMINRRFHLYDHGEKKGVANPKKDSFIALVVHPRYRDNLARYIRVIQHIPVRESGAGLGQRLGELRAMLFDPDTASEAAIHLEAIGEDGLPVLREGLTNDNLEVRFFSAEALAYLDDSSAIPELADAIRNEPALRWRGFLAFQAMENVLAQESLAELMREESAETRYGAFRALLKLNSDDSLVRRETLGDEFRLHAVPVGSGAMVHVSKSDSPEIVVFGEEVKLNAPLVAFAGKRIVVRSTDEGQILVRQLTDTDDGDRQLIVDPDVTTVVRAIVELGGKYADVVEALAEARSKGSLDCRLDFGAIPRPGRKLYRDRDEAKKKPAMEVASRSDDSPLSAKDDLAHLKSVLANDSVASPVFSDDFAGHGAQVNQAKQGDEIAAIDLASPAPSGPKPIEVIITDETSDGYNDEILFDDPEPLLDPVGVDMAPPATVIDAIRP